MHVWNCVYLGKSGADSDTDEDGDGGDKTGGESISQWVKQNSSKLNFKILNDTGIFHENWSTVALKDLCYILNYVFFGRMTMSCYC